MNIQQRIDELEAEHFLGFGGYAPAEGFRQKFRAALKTLASEIQAEHQGEKQVEDKLKAMRIDFANPSKEEIVSALQKMNGHSCTCEGCKQDEQEANRLIELLTDFRGSEKQCNHLNTEYVGYAGKRCLDCGHTWED